MEGINNAYSAHALSNTSTHTHTYASAQERMQIQQEGSVVSLPFTTSAVTSRS
jgi:hypothetical protein